MADDEEVARLRERYLEIQRKKNKFNFSIPYRLRFPLAWTLFFAIVGITQQSIVGKAFVFVDFFWKNYIDWFASFGNFASTYKVSSSQEFLLMLLGHWYYFFFTGGLISIIWALIYILTHIELKAKRDDFAPDAI